MKTLALIAMSLLLAACGSEARKRADARETFVNPVFEGNMNTFVTFHEGNYYYAHNELGKIFLRVSGDLTDLANAEPKAICDMEGDYGLIHLWRPNLVNIDGVWYLYTTADDGNNDNHQLYVLSNGSEDPMEGEFRMLGRISTDTDHNWAIHSSVFRFRDELYMIWSGWVTRRVFAETQCIFIARMKNPWTLDGRRVLISKPEYEWECQWINADGGMATAYPLFVNESPVFFCNDRTDKAYIYYSASANWTPYTAIGELSAAKDADLLDPASWSKRPHPVMRQSDRAGVYGPGTPCLVPSPDGSQHWLVYKAKDEGGASAVYMKRIEIDPRGIPDLGQPATRGETYRKPSGTELKL